MDFDGRVVIVTGAGGNPGLGRSHAHLLAELGARVVVNDLGVGPNGRGELRANAERVVEEIRSNGGEAVADTNSVSSEDGAHAIVATALEQWGRLDGVVNNAGVLEFALLEELSAFDIKKMIDVHLYGTIWTCRAAWPYLKHSGEGRIVNTVSGAVLGERYSTIYGAVKGGILSLTRALAIEGAEHGIKVNALAPGAVTVLWQTVSDVPPPDAVVADLDPDLVSPAVAYLTHPVCEPSGKCVASEGGRVYETFFGQTVGYANRSMTPDDLVANWSQVVDRGDYHDVGDPRVAGGGFSLSPRPYVPAAEN